MTKPVETFALPRWPVSRLDVPPLGQHVKKTGLSEADYQALAHYLAVVSASDFALDVLVKPAAGDGLTVSGTATLSIVQQCVLTLEPVNNRLNAAIDLTLLPAHSMPEPVEQAEDETMPDNDPPDLLENDSVDLGTVAAEFLLLEVDPYPRKEGAEFGIQGDGEGQSPFAALAALKKER